MAPSQSLVTEAGTYSATFVIVPLSREEAQSLLPVHLKLGQQSLTPPGTYPLLCMFGAQKDVRTVFPHTDSVPVEDVLSFFEQLTGQPPHPSLSPDGGGEGRVRGTDTLPLQHWNYREVVTVVPFVEWAKPPTTCPSSFVFPPRLYLDMLLPTLGGWLWGYPKREARISAVPSAGCRYLGGLWQLLGMGAGNVGTANSFQVRTLFGDHLLFTGRFAPQGPSRRPDDCANFAEVRPMLKLPIVGQTRLGPFLGSVLDFKLDQAQMWVGPAEVAFESGFFDPSVGRKTLSVQGIDKVRLGAFCLDVPWSLAPPVHCAPVLSGP